MTPEKQEEIRKRAEAATPIECADRVVDLWERLKGIPMGRDRDTFKRGISDILAYAMESQRETLSTTQARLAQAERERDAKDAEVGRLRAALEAEQKRWDWFFGPTRKTHSMEGYMRGRNDLWTPDQWRAWADAATAAREGE